MVSKRLYGFIDQSPHDLALTLVEGDLDRNRFQCLQGRTVQLRGVEIEATVIGASHIVSFTVAGSRLHEVFACVGLPDSPSLSVDELVRHPQKRMLAGMTYKMTAHYVAWGDSEPPELVRLIADDNRPGETTIFRMVQDFPRGDFLVTPKTVVVGYAGANGEIVIRTAHSYPAQGVVFTRTTLSHT